MRTGPTQETYVRMPIELHSWIKATAAAHRVSVQKLLVGWLQEIKDAELSKTRDLADRPERKDGAP